MSITKHWETGGIKIHGVEHSLIRRNVILRTHYCASLWFDGMVLNTRITQNVIADLGESPLGMVFLEMSSGPILVDNNVVVSSGHSGVYEYDSARMVVVQNLVANGKGTAVHLSYGHPPRTPNAINDAGDQVGRAHVYENHHRVYGNILSGFRQYVRFPNRTGRSDWNVLAGIANDSKEELPKPFQILGDQGLEMKPKDESFDLPQWRKIGNEVHSVEMPMQVAFDEERLELRTTAAEGAELPVFSPAPTLPPVATSGTDWHYDAAGLLRRKTEYRSHGGWIRRPIPEVASLEELLTVDLLGQPREKGRFSPGPLRELPLDGSPMRVDPRQLLTGRSGH